MTDSNIDPDLLARLRGFFFPRGEDLARGVRAIRNTQRGEMRSGPGSPWIPFTSDERIDSDRSGFHWEARYTGGKLGWVSVTDAYENGHGRTVIKLGGIIPVRKFSGPEFDRGELQRYLASIVLCPPILLNHPSLDCRPLDANTLRVADKADPTGATVDMEVSEAGQPLRFRTERPRAVGKASVLTPWSAISSRFEEREGLRIAHRLQVFWTLPEGEFEYYRADVTSLELLR